MKISIITVFPEIYESFLKTSLVARATGKGLVEFNLVRMSDMCKPKEHIDEPTCGPGTGMIIKPEIIERAIESCEKKWNKGFKIFFSPQGKKLDQRLFQKLAKNIRSYGSTSSPRTNDIIKVAVRGELVEPYEQIKKSNYSHLILVCSRYEGMDVRVEEYYADEILSIGDYVVMGGDLPAQVFLEGILRLIPGVVGKQESVEQESFTSAFLDCPEYGLPVEWKDKKIPEIVRSGNHAQIEKWRTEQAAKKTVQKRFDWFVLSNPSEKEIDLAKKFIPNHYVALMHTQILVKKDQVGNTSITSLDIHDIARSCATYGIKNYFMVTLLKDQQKILNKFLDFWKSQEGKDYNLSRFVAVQRVVPSFSLDDVIAKIKEQENVEPLIIATSARDVLAGKQIDFFSQSQIFKLNRPVLFIFGTGHGLSEKVLKKSDFILCPVKGMTDYNHLSVRSAAAIVLDRWLGLNSIIIE